MKEEIEPLSEYTMNAARESIEEYRYSRDYPAKAGAMSALAIILYDDAVRARARRAVCFEGPRQCLN